MKAERTRGDEAIVIYADVLLIVNFFLTLLQLALTAKLIKHTLRTWRLVLASAAGALYALIIFADTLPEAVLALTRVLSAAVIVLLAFRFYRVRSFLAAWGIFVGTGFVFLGAAVGAVLLFHPDGIILHNSAVYFDISARALLGCALAAYLLSCGAVRLYNRHVAKNEIYTLTAYKGGESVTFLAFADTGNRLREPFSGAPVIVCGSEAVREFAAGFEKRLIPASTVSGTAMLEAFKPDLLVIRTAAGEEKLDNVYIACTDEMENERYGAVFNPEILSV